METWEVEVNKEAELRRANEELTSACRQLEEQNQRLRAENKRLRALKSAPPPAPVKPDVPTPHSIVTYVDGGGHEHWALVEKVLPNEALRLKVFRRAAPDLVLDAQRERGEGQRRCWRRL